MEASRRRSPNCKHGCAPPRITRRNRRDRKRRYDMAATEHGKTVLNTQEARQGKELGVMRYVLHISLALAVIAGIVVYAIFH